MKNIVSLDPLYKRDSTGRIRIWTVEYGCDTIDGPAGVRTIAGLVSGQKVTSIWNMKEPKNTGKKMLQLLGNKPHLKLKVLGIEELKKSFSKILRT